MSVRRRAMIENGGGSMILDDGGWKDVEDIGCKVKSVGPIGRRDGGMNEICANDVI